MSRGHEQQAHMTCDPPMASPGQVWSVSALLVRLRPRVVHLWPRLEQRHLQHFPNQFRHRIRKRPQQAGRADGLPQRGSLPGAGPLPTPFARNNVIALNATFPLVGNEYGLYSPPSTSCSTKTMIGSDGKQSRLVAVENAHPTVDTLTPTAAWLCAARVPTSSNVSLWRMRPTIRSARREFSSGLDESNSHTSRKHGETRRLKMEPEAPVCMASMHSGGEQSAACNCFVENSLFFRFFIPSKSLV